MSILKVGTDFSGIGAPEQALKELNVPHSVEFACDKDKYARQTYLANHETKIMYEDITMRDHGSAPYVDLYCFGFPCQTFSLSGNRKGFDDIRGTLFFNSADYIRTHRPKVFIAENVKGLLSHDKPKGSKATYGRTFSTIINVLAKTVNKQPSFGMYEDNLRYNVYYTVLNSKYFDVAQSRERVFIVGFRDDVDFNFPFSRIISKRLKDILEPVVDNKYFPPQKMIDNLFRWDARNTENGDGFGLNIKTGDDISSTLSTGSMKSSSTLIDVEPEIEKIGYINQDTQASQVYGTSGIAPTICANTHGYAMGFIETNQGGATNKRIRRLTPLEFMRLQGFDDSFIKPCSETQTYKQSGNSITVSVIKAIIKNVLTAIKFE